MHFMIIWSKVQTLTQSCQQPTKRFYSYSHKIEGGVFSALGAFRDTRPEEERNWIRRVVLDQRVLPTSLLALSISSEAVKALVAYRKE